MPPADPALWPKFAEFLRQLRDGADQLAATLDTPTEVPDGDN
jgi:hypothetical protein